MIACMCYKNLPKRYIPGWQEIYNNSPRQLYRGFKDFSEEFVPNILGGEVCLWTESAGGMSVEGKIWPRTAGLGERLWSDPVTGIVALSIVLKNSIINDSNFAILQNS